MTCSNYKQSPKGHSCVCWAEAPVLHSSRLTARWDRLPGKSSAVSQVFAAINFEDYHKNYRDTNKSTQHKNQFIVGTQKKKFLKKIFLNKDKFTSLSAKFMMFKVLFFFQITLFSAVIKMYCFPLFLFLSCKLWIQTVLRDREINSKNSSLPNNILSKTAKILIFHKKR